MASRWCQRAVHARWARSLPFCIGKIPSYNGAMESSITIDKAGRVVIPKEIRDKLRLRAGDSLSLKCEGDSLTLQPIHAGAPLRKEHGIWVFNGGNPLSLEEANQIVLDVRRDRENIGERRR
jgi:AbrB family looped-hinge helix DNA binding protein